MPHLVVAQFRVEWWIFFEIIFVFNTVLYTGQRFTEINVRQISFHFFLLLNAIFAFPFRRFPTKCKQIEADDVSRCLSRLLQQKKMEHSILIIRHMQRNDFHLLYTFYYATSAVINITMEQILLLFCFLQQHTVMMSPKSYNTQSQYTVSGLDSFFASFIILMCPHLFNNQIYCFNC